MPGEALRRAWMRRGALACVLWPVSLLFGRIVALRRSLYRLGLIKSQQVGVPVIIVGNVVAGGTGKTPVVIALVEHLRARGVHCGVVSRGHGRNTSGCREVTAHSGAAEVGDEPLLIKLRGQVPVFVAARRDEAARALLAAHPTVQVIIGDDGLQHHALARDIEICLFDQRGSGNGWLLPAGPLREPWPRPVDLVLTSGSPSGIGGFGLSRRLADHARRADGERISLASLRGRPCKAVAGIATPEAFFEMLRSQGLELAETTPLPDHHDFETISTKADPDFSLLCTEKDAVKLWRRQPGAWAVPLMLEIEPAFWSALDGLLKAKLSFVHGSETS